MSTHQHSIQLAPASERELDELKGDGWGNLSSIVRLAIHEFHERHHATATPRQWRDSRAEYIEEHPEREEGE